MSIKFTVDDSETLRELSELFPKHFLKQVAVAIKNLARNNAQEQARRSHGRLFWQREVVQSVHEQVNGNTAEIYSDSYKAEHAHTGGVIRPVTRASTWRSRSTANCGTRGPRNFRGAPKTASQYSCPVDAVPVG